MDQLSDDPALLAVIGHVAVVLGVTQITQLILGNSQSYINDQSPLIDMTRW